MFTGIITHRGTVAEAARSRIAVRAPREMLRALAIGASVAVDGACLTVISKTKDIFTADLLAETARKTVLGNIQAGASVNLELPATPGTFLSGHIVQGHVDGIGVVRKLETRSGDHLLSIGVPQPIARFLVSKGSVALDGVSLTVIDVRRAGFTVSVTPHTWRATTLAALSPGTRVNIEVDVLAKYVEKLLAKNKP